MNVQNAPPIETDQSASTPGLGRSMPQPARPRTPPEITLQDAMEMARLAGGVIHSLECFKVAENARVEARQFLGRYPDFCRICEGVGTVVEVIPAAGGGVTNCTDWCVCTEEGNCSLCLTTLEPSAGERSCPNGCGGYGPIPRWYPRPVVCACGFSLDAGKPVRGDLSYRLDERFIPVVMANPLVDVIVASVGRILQGGPGAAEAAVQMVETLIPLDVAVDNLIRKLRADGTEIDRAGHTYKLSMDGQFLVCDDDEADAGKDGVADSIATD